MRVTNEILSHTSFKDFTIHVSFLRKLLHEIFPQKEEDKMLRKIFPQKEKIKC